MPKRVADRHAVGAPETRAMTLVDAEITFRAVPARLHELRIRQELRRDRTAGRVLAVEGARGFRQRVVAAHIHARSQPIGRLERDALVLAIDDVGVLDQRQGRTCRQADRSPGRSSCPCAPRRSRCSRERRSRRAPSRVRRADARRRPPTRSTFGESSESPMRDDTPGISTSAERPAGAAIGVEPVEHRLNGLRRRHQRRRWHPD